MQAIEGKNCDAAILSLDFYKAYDRLCVSFLEKVMVAMRFHPSFIEWIKLLHRGARTRLLLDVISDPILLDFYGSVQYLC